MAKQVFLWHRSSVSGLLALSMNLDFLKFFGVICLIGGQLTTIRQLLVVIYAPAVYHNYMWIVKYIFWQKWDLFIIEGSIAHWIPVKCSANH